MLWARWVHLNCRIIKKRIVNRPILKHVNDIIWVDTPQRVILILLRLNVLDFPFLKIFKVGLHVQ